MSSVRMFKKEVVVLFDLLNIADIPCSIGNMPAVSKEEYATIKESFCETGAVMYKDNGIKLDKGLSKYIVPIANTRQVLLFNYGEDKRCKRNVSLYFSNNSAVAVLEKQSEYIEFIKISSFKELLLILPSVDEIPQDKESYFSFVLFNETSATVYVATVDANKDSVTVIEVKRLPGQPADEKKTTITVSQFADEFITKLEETCNVFDS